jgi:hypothetical protein
MDPKEMFRLYRLDSSGTQQGSEASSSERSKFLDQLQKDSILQS